MKLKSGILLVNLGTPSAPTPQAVREFLGDFLSDQRVIDLPRLLWLPILYGIVLRVRPKRVAKLYQNIWQPGGSPMRVMGEQQVAAIKKALSEKYPQHDITVRLAMRYGEPNIKTVLKDFTDQKINNLIVLPLFPQYSATTTAAIFDTVAAYYAKQPHIPTLRFINNYAEETAYIEALANSISEYWQQHGRGEKLIMSFHGIPTRYVRQGDPYPTHCVATANAVAQKLQLKQDEWLLTFQSRFGYDEWLQPYTDMTLIDLAKKGIKRLDILSPAFSADCLETLEELAITNKELFLENGGKEYHYIPALNDRADHMAFLGALVARALL